jgi:Protein of unknown function (DUF1573)
MKGWVVILVLLFPALVYAEPSIRFESELHDFGTVKQGDFLEFAFEFKNAGTEDLFIRQLTAS